MSGSGRQSVKGGGKPARVPDGAAVRFTRWGGEAVLQEYRAGQPLPRTTWGDKEHYARGDSFGVSTFAVKDLRKLDSLFPGHKMPGGGATVGSLLMALLGEKGEEFVFGWEIVRISPSPGDEFAGVVRVRPYFAPKDEADDKAKRTYGKEEDWFADARRGHNADDLHARFTVQRHIHHASGAVETIMEASVILVDSAIGGVPKKAGKKFLKEAAKSAVKKVAGDSKGRALARKAIGRVAKAVSALGESLDHWAVAAVSSFVKAFSADLLNQSQKRPSVLAAAAADFKLPATTVILITQTAEEVVTIAWGQAAHAGAIAAAGTVVENFLSAKFTKAVSKNIEIDMQILKSHASGGEHTIRKELREQFGNLFYKLLFTDQVTRVIKAIGTAGKDAKNAEEFPGKLREALAKEFNPEEVAKSAIKEGLSAFAATGPA